MRKLIDLDEATLKSYIESVLVTHAGGQSKDQASGPACVQGLGIVANEHWFMRVAIKEN
jgi:hypothetical protein